MLRRLKILILEAGLCPAILSGAISAAQQPDAAQKKLDPAAWGSSHAGKPVPEYISGDECLFCHRNDIGPGWQKNAHGKALRQREDAPEIAAILKSEPRILAMAPQIEFFLGSRKHVRFLKKDGYGRFAILSARAELNESGAAQKWIGAERAAWDKDRFAAKCVGCHTTGVNPKDNTFTAFGLDCYTCHGVVDLEHTNDISKIFLSKKRRSDARVITSTCASCHLRGGKSRSTGLPFPNNFVAGDNLFQDFLVDFSKADDESLNPGDRHIYRNVRDVVVSGIEYPTCINCHDVHKNTSFKHRRAPRTAICADCHNAEGTIKGSKPYTVHSEVCEY
jgi:predicted CXXCH cytochrome family protein